jgi:acetolactate synthase-1/3 small subunit
MKPRIHTLIAYVEDRPGVLNRVASLFRRRAYNIVSLTVGRTEEDGLSRMTVVVEADDDTARRLQANLYKLVNVLMVEDLTDAPGVVRELALVKVKAPVEARPEIVRLCEVFRARVVEVGAEMIVVEGTGSVDQVDSLIEILRPFGIVELVRTGGVAMARGESQARRLLAEANGNGDRDPESNRAA